MSSTVITDNVTMVFTTLSSNDSNSLNNSSNQTSTGKPQNEMLFDYFLFVLYFFTAIVAIFGNLFVCYVIYKTKKFKSATFLLLFNMALSDFFSGLVILTQWFFCSYHVLENYSERPCNINKAFQILSYYISTYSMMFIAIDRYMLITHPHSKGLQSKKHKYLAVSSTWIVGFLFSLTCLFNMRVNEYFTPTQLVFCRITFKLEDGNISFVLRKYRIAILIVSQFLIPLIITSILYKKIWNIIDKREMVGNQTDLKRKQFSKNKKKLIKMLVLVVVAFIVAWVPVHTIHIFNFYIIKLLPKGCNGGLPYNLAYWLSINSCCLNVFIYYYGNEDFKKEASILYCKFVGKKAPQDFSMEETTEISNVTTSSKA